MFRRLLLLWIGLLSLGLTGGRAYAQTPPEAIQVLQVDIWPDYDQASTLVLLTGSLPEISPLPAQVTIPLPANAQLNAVARITPENVMTDDIKWDVDEVGVTFTTSDLAFRVEYYVPYEQVGASRTAVFDWQSSLGVTQMSVTVQQPSSATNFSIDPTPARVATSEFDGLTYHTLGSVIVPPGTLYRITTQYDLPNNQLTAEAFIVEETAVSPTEKPSNNLALYLIATGLFLISIALFWQVWRERQPQPVKPAPQKRFCRECGAPVTAKDTFCRECGTQLR